MRILQVSSAGALGGGETHVLELVEALRKRGHEVLVAGRAKGPLQPDVGLPFLNSVDFFSALRLRSVIKKQAFDILHAHVARDYTICAAALWEFPRPKLVLTRHLLHPIRRHPLYRRVDGWIAPTSQILTTIEPLAPRAAAVIPNWVNLEKFEYRPRPLHEPVAIGVLGQISAHKGHDDAVEASRRLGTGYRLVIGGTGDPAYVAALKKKANGLDVQFAGFVSLPEFFEAVDILAVPSWEEPFGLVLLEAMAAGIPVIATNRGGPVDIISSVQHGILIPPRDPAALAGAISSLAADDNRRVALAKHARNHVEEHFDIRKVVPRIEDFYSRLKAS